MRQTKNVKENKLRVHMPGQGADEKPIVMDEPKIKWYRRRLYWTLQERLAYDLVLMAVLAVLLYLLFHYIIGIASVNGQSMYPTLQEGQLVLFNRVDRKFQTGDIISVRMPSGEFYVKRIVAVAGDTVDVRDGQLYVNGAEVNEPYADGATDPEDGTVEYPVTVADGNYFVLGDNREKSNDSRAFGTIIKARITGKVFFYMGTVK